MKLIDYLLTIFETRWNTTFSIDSFGCTKTFKEFVKEVRWFLNMLSNLKDLHGPNIKIALTGQNSTEYISCYVALLFSQLDFCLIPHKIKDTRLIPMLANDINFIFIDKADWNPRIIKTLNNLPWFKGVVDIKDKDLTFVREEKFSALKKDVYELFPNRKNRIIKVFSSSVDKIYPHTVDFDNDTVYEGLMKLVLTDKLPNLFKEGVYSEVDYSYAPIWTMLWPLVSGAKFSSDYPQSATIFFESTYSFEREWDYITQGLYEKWIIGKLLMKNWLYWFFKILVRYKLKRHFNTDKRVKAVIIINAILSPRIMKIILTGPFGIPAPILPIYTTYGMQECNHILAINDYSKFEHCELNCVGELLENVTGEISDESLRIVSSALTKEIPHPNDIWYNTKDHASMRDRLVFVYGKKRYSFKNSVYTGTNFENIERLLKSVPYFKDVFVFEDELGSYHLMIYPNLKIVQAMKYGLLDFTNFIKPYMRLMNESYDQTFFQDITINFTDFLRSHTNKIQKGWYYMVVESQNDLEEDVDVDID